MGIFDKPSRCSRCDKGFTIFDSMIWIKDGAICQNCLHDIGITLGDANAISSLRNMTVEEIESLRANQIREIEEMKAAAKDAKEANPQLLLESLKADGMLYYEGVRGRKIKVYEDRVQIITTVTAGSILAGNATDGEKTIFYADCVGVQFKEAGLTLGYIQLETSGGSLMNNKTNNFFNENTFTYDPSVATNEEMRNLAALIRDKVSEYKSKGNQNSGVQGKPLVDPVEEIKRYKELLDMDIITEEEFKMKKKELLGL